MQPFPHFDHKRNDIGEVLLSLGEESPLPTFETCGSVIAILGRANSFPCILDPWNLSGHLCKAVINASSLDGEFGRDGDSDFFNL